jgi:formamidopyrimidine-DNA glycosylase
LSIAQASSRLKQQSNKQQATNNLPKSATTETSGVTTMVEGPGATRNCRKVQLAVGKILIGTSSFSSTLIQKICEQVAESSSDDNDTSGAAMLMLTVPHRIGEELTNHSLSEAFTVGKELFLIFTYAHNSENDIISSCREEIALRLHFGMNGSLSALKVKSSDIPRRKSAVAHWKQSTAPSIRLHFSEFSGDSGGYVIVEAWDTTVTYPVNATMARMKLSQLASRDVCSTSFNAQDVFASIRQSGADSIVSDVLLNQDIFPGVGNIIKIESLHRSKIDPRRIVSTLTGVELRRLVRHARQFSMDWLQSGRAGTKLVYNQTKCGTCQALSVKMQKIGGGSSGIDNCIISGSQKGHAFMSRVTFWCSHCQPLHPSASTGTECPLKSVSNDDIMADKAKSTIRHQACCPQHGMKSIKLCRVRKENTNYLRIFMTCTVKNCQFFLWADGSFSVCRCEKKAVLRISKTERSGGRWFLCCANGDRGSKVGGSIGCGYFEWATDQHLMHLKSLLTPLL